MTTSSTSSEFSIVISGMGIFCPIGKNIREFQNELMNGSDGIREIERFDTSQFNAHYAAMFNMQEWQNLSKDYPDLDHRITMAVESAKEACQMAAYERFLPEKIGLVLGICIGKMSEDDIYSENVQTQQNPNLIQLSNLQYQTRLIADQMQIEGPVFAISTACASSNHALGFALDLLRFGYLDAVLVGGTSEVTLNMFAGFYALGNMSSSPCAPFSVPFGLNLGEGAGFLFLERLNNFEEETIPTLGAISGFGASGDAYHPTSPDPNGSGVERAIQTCLNDAGLGPDDIGYINVHGTGTQDNDLAEWLGIKKVFGDYSRHLPVSSSKSFMGHTGAAAGIIETIITVIAMNSGVVPTTLHFTKPRRLIPDRLIIDVKPLSHNYQNAINCNSGFGGANAAMVISKNRVSSWGVERIENIEILGCGSVSAYGIDNLGEALFGKCPKLSIPPSGTETHHQPTCSVPEIDFSTFTDGKENRYLDPVSRYMITASTRAIQDSNIHVKQEYSESTGIVTAVSNIPSQSLSDFRESIKSRSLLGNSSHAFSKIVMNAAMGAVSEVCYIKGPSVTIAASEEAGIFAAAYACMSLIHNPGLDYMLAVAADELGEIPLSLHALSNRPFLPTEGAGCVIFGRRHNQRVTEKSVQVKGLSIGGSGQLSAVIRNALGNHDKDDIDIIFTSNDGTDASCALHEIAIREIYPDSYNKMVLFNPAPYMGYADACTSIFSLILAAQALAKGKLEILNSKRKIYKKPVNKILVTAVNKNNGSCAILLERPVLH